MHPHTKQWLEKFDDRYVRKTPYIELWRETKTQDEQIKEMKLFLVEALKSQAQMIRDEMVPNEWKNNEGCIGGKECSAVLGFNSFRNEMRFKLDNLINSFK